MRKNYLGLIFFLCIFSYQIHAQSLSSINAQVGLNLYSFDQSFKTGAGSGKYGYYSYNDGFKIGLGIVFKFNSDLIRLENNLFYFREKLNIQRTRTVPSYNHKDPYDLLYTNNVLQDQVIFIVSDRKNNFNLRLGLAIDLVLNTTTTDLGSSHRENGDPSFIYGGEGDQFIYCQLSPLIGISYGSYPLKFAFDYIPGVTPRYITGTVDPNHPYFRGSNDSENWEGQKMVRSMWTFTFIMNIYQFKEKKE